MVDGMSAILYKFPRAIGAHLQRSISMSSRYNERLSLYPLTEALQRARIAFRQGGSEDAFRKALKALGLDWTSIQLEVAEARLEPEWRHLGAITMPIVERLKS
jgi:hypothetical protein